MESLSQTKQTVEMVIDEIQKTGMNFALNKDILKLIYLDWDINNQYEILSNINQLFNSKISTSNYINSIYLYSSDHKKIITSNGIINYEDFFDNKIIQAASQRKELSLWLPPRILKINDHPQEKVLSYILKIPVSSNSTRGILVINVKEEIFNKTLLNLNNKLLGNIVILNETDEIMSVKSNYLLNIEDYSYKDIDKSTSMGYFNKRINKIPFFISYVKSDYNNWTYIASNSLHEMFKESSEIIFVILIATALGFLISILLAIFISKHYYLPIKSLKSLLTKNSSMENLSSSDTYNSIDDFEQIANHINNIMISNADLKRRFSENKLLLREHFLLNLIYIGNSNIADVEDKFKYYDINFQMSGFQVILLNLSYHDSVQKLTQKDANMLGYSINSICQGEISKYSKGVVINRDDNNFILLLNHGNVNSEDADDISNRIVLNIQNEINNLINADLFAAIGGYYTNVSEINLSYIEALDILSYKRISGNNCIISIKDVTSNIGNKKHLLILQNQIQLFTNELKLGNHEEAHSVMEDIFSFINTENTFGYNNKSYILMQMINAIAVLLLDLNGTVEEILGANIYNEFSHLKTFNDIKSWFSCLIDKTISYITLTNEIKQNDIIEKVLSYVSDHYHEDISVQIISDFVFLNPTYFCKVFKDSYGKTFGEFLTEFRLRKAYNDLLETNQTLDEIALKNGFKNKLNLIRAFKKHYSMTPTQARSSHVKNLMSQ